MQPSTVVRRRRSVSGEVGAYVEQLLESELSPGDRLPPERELAALLHVSRTSVRAAMSEFERRRRVERVPGRGTTVMPRPPACAELERQLELETPELADVAELRMVIEPQIAGLAAARAAESDLVLLEQALADAHAGLTAGESLKMDERFHGRLAAAAGNPLLLSLCDMTSGWVRDVRSRSHYTRAGRRSSVEWHRKLFAAVAAHDQAAATQAMIDHLHAVAQLAAEATP